MYCSKNIKPLQDALDWQVSRKWASEAGDKALREPGTEDIPLSIDKHLESKSLTGGSTAESRNSFL